METTRLTPVKEIGATSEFDGFFRIEYPRLVKALYLTVADLPEAEELAQEAMARVYERWDRVKAMDSPGGYLYRTALNLNRNRLRRLAVRARRFLRPPDPADDMVAVEARSDLLRALEGLPDGQKEALVLVEWLEMTSEEASRVLGIRPASVRSRANRARETLRERLEVRDG
jgi:RNA polymerase sigma-70 factor (ECF subfamily)